jgi:hypothetical protein
MIAGAGASFAGKKRYSPLSRALGRLIVLAEENGTMVALVFAALVAFVARLPSDIGSDSWMVLLSGREIVQHGLPSHDYLTVWSRGRPWVDQQWLAQVTMYSIERLGGIRLVMLTHAALATGGFATACVVARRRGASALSVTWIGAIGLLAFYPEAANMRSQSFAYPLFVAVLALLLRDGRRPSNGVFLVFPLLALWANLHGSVVVGAALVSLYGLVALRGARDGGWARPIVLTIVPWACVVASPYAASLPSYYRWILFDVHFNRFITEWAPTALSLVTAPVFVLAIGGAWLLGRGHRTAGAFEALAFVGTAVLAFEAKRNLPWFGLAAVAILPTLLDHVRTPAAEPRRANRILAGAAVLGAAATIAGIAAKTDSWFLQRYPATAANVAAEAAGGTRRVFANESYADWLVWERPELAGRIAFDDRFELLTDAQLASLLEFRTGIGDWRAAAAGYDVLVLSARDEAPAIAALTRHGEARLVAADRGIVVLRRKAAA